MRPLIFATILVCVHSGALWASDLTREQRIADEIEEAILEGEPIRLKAGDIEFLAIYAEEESDRRKGAAILLHGRGAHPDWPDVIYPLRSELPAAGWQTLSIQLPVAASDAGGSAYRALVPESYPRIDAAVSYLKAQGVEPLVIIGHSLGARMGITYLGEKGAGDISAFVAVGLSAERAHREGGTLDALQKVKLPILDLYGSRDLESVLNSSKQRASAARKAGNSDYRQVQIDGADHFFRGLEETLVNQVGGYIGGVVGR